MAKSKFAKRLSAMKKNFARAKNEAGSMFGSLDIEPAQYNAQLSSIKFQENKKKGTLLCISEFLLTDGEYEGAKVPVFHYPENESAQPFFVRYIEVLSGFEFPKDPAELEDLFDELSEEAPECVIEIEKNKGTGANEGKVFTNVNLIERLSEVSEGDEEEEESETETEETDTEETEEEEVSEDADEEGEEEEEDSDEDGSEEEEEEDSEDESEEDEELLSSAVEFCEVNEIDFEEDDTVEILAERISSEMYSGDSMGPDELALFEALDIMSCVEMPKKKAPKLKKSVKEKAASKKKKEKEEKKTSKKSTKKTTKKTSKKAAEKPASKKKVLKRKKK